MLASKQYCTRYYRIVPGTVPTPEGTAGYPVYLVLSSPKSVMWRQEQFLHFCMLLLLVLDLYISKNDDHH